MKTIEENTHRGRGAFEDIGPDHAERRVYFSEHGNEGDDVPFTVETQFAEHHEDKLCAGIIIIAEATVCNEIATCKMVIQNKQPFRDNEVFQLRKATPTSKKWKATFFMKNR
jgi:hypothetical protein